MPITALPTPPSRSDTPANFVTKADAFIAALPQFITEANDQAALLTLASTTDTSVTSNAIGTGAKTFTVSAGKSFQPGMYLVIADTAAPSTNSMYGQVTSYSGTSLVMNILSALGSGTKTAWTISQSAAGGAGLGANTFTGLQTLSAGADIASATTVDLTAATGNTPRITGTTPITAFTMNAGQQMELIAVGALPLTYHATTMNINGGVSYTCAAGDRLFVNKANDDVIRVNVIKQDGTPVVSIPGVEAGTVIDYSGVTVPSGYLACPLAQTNINRATYAALWSALHKESTVTISIATPGVITWNAHPLVNGLPVILSTTGALPTGLVAGTIYYVVGATANTFNLSATVGGAAINTTGSQSGVHTAVCAPWGIGDGSTTFGMPWYPADYASVQENANVGTNSVGQVIAHTHNYTNPAIGSTPVGAGGGSNQAYSTGNGGTTTSTGGAANLAAGVRVKKCVKY